MTAKTVEDAAEAIRQEYGTYVAKGPIDIDGARAFNTGDAVPVSHVASGVVSQTSVTKKG